MDGKTGRPQLSVGMIVRDAARGVAASLASLQGWDAEVIVLDTGSRDDSVAVARRHGATVVTRPWDDDFSAARNACWEHLHGDWVLWLDAGEVVPEPTAQRVREITAQPAADEVFSLLVRLPPPAHGGAAEQIARLRLAPNRPALRFRGRVRESFAAAVESLGWRHTLLELPLLRGVEENEPATKVRRARRNLRLAELALAEDGPQPIWFNCLAEAFQSLDDLPRAAAHYRLALAQSAPGSLPMLEAYYGLLTCFDGSPESREQQVLLGVTAVEQFPLDVQLLCALGGYLQQLPQPRLDLVTRSYETAFRYGQLHPELWHLEDMPAVAGSCLATSLLLQQRAEEAQRVLEETVERFGHLMRVRRQLLELYVRAGHRDLALKQAEMLSPSLPQPEAFRAAVRGACLASGGQWRTARAHLQAAFQHGCRDGLALRWLAATHAALGDQPAAHAVLEAWLQVEPHNAEARRLRAEWSAESQHAEPQHAEPKYAPPELPTPASDESDRMLRVDSRDAGPHPDPVPTRLSFRSLNAKK